jgi:L-seryl-tRNA(Ser) seleniumtransferase
LHQLVREGADLVAVSGGKGFRGPQASGLLCGRPDLLDAVALHHQDMDERDTTWLRSSLSGNPDITATVVGSSTPPRHGIGRGMKVGPEQVLGLCAAVERYLRDPGADNRAGLVELDEAEAVLGVEGGLQVARVFDEGLDVPVLHIDFSGSGYSADTIAARLVAGNPRVFLGEELAWRGVLILNPMALGKGEGGVLGEAVRVAINTRKVPADHQIEDR